MTLQLMLLKIRKAIWKYTLTKLCPLSLSLLSQSVLKCMCSTANCLYLHDSYISKFEFTNYLFLNLVVARLYLV